MAQKSRAAGIALAVKRGDLKMEDVSPRSKAAVKVMVTEFDDDHLKRLSLGEAPKIQNFSFMTQGTKLRRAVV